MKRFSTIITILSCIGLVILAGKKQSFAEYQSSKFEFYKDISKSSVFIMSTDKYGGSGFHLKTKNNNVIIITNYHVCFAAIYYNYPLAVFQSNDVENKKLLKVIKFQRSTDLCAIEPLDLNNYFNLAKTVEYLEPVFVVGHPNLMPTRIQEGHVGPLVKVPTYLPTFLGDEPIVLNQQLFSAPIFPGSSGSAVLNVNKEVVGVTSHAQAKEPIDIHNNTMVTRKQLEEFVSDL